MGRAKLALAMCLVAFFLVGQYSCTPSETSPMTKVEMPDSFTCDAENVYGNILATEISSLSLTGEFSPDNSKFRSGKQSLRLDAEHNSAFAIDISGIDFLDEIVLRVWRYTAGGQVQLSIGCDNLPLTTGMSTGNVEGDWEEVELRFLQHVELNNQAIFLRCTLTDAEQSPAWVDDFSFEFRFRSEIATFELGSDAALSISLSEDAMAQLEKIRDEALKSNVLIRQPNDLVTARFNEIDSAEVRLKGDWVDHLKGEKWSMRVELPKGEYWNGMRKFSIQSVATRNMLNEWVLHKLFEHEDILTTKYGFEPVEINGELKGIYAVEEHFNKALLERSQRREGPILKFEDEIYFAKSREEGALELMYPYRDAAIISMYSRKRFFKNDVLRAQAIAGRNLLFAHQHNKLPAGDIFDIDRMARFAAIVDLMNASHSWAWPNLRFYYNPVSCRLEPIGFDGDSKLKYVEQKPKLYLDKIFNGNGVDLNVANLLSDSAFVEQYMHYLHAYSSDAFVDSFFRTIGSELTAQETFLQREFSNYEFPKDEFVERAAAMRLKLESFTLRALHSFRRKLKAKPFAPTIMPKKPLNGVSVVAYTALDTAGKQVVQTANYYCKPITVLKILGDSAEHELPNGVKLPAYSETGGLNSTDIQVSFAARAVEYEADGVVYTLPVTKYPLSSINHPRSEEENYWDQANASYSIHGNQVIFSGSNKISKPIIIPEGYTVTIKKGCSLDLIEGAFILSNSPIVARGSGEEGIQITSSDKTGQGLALIGCDSASEFYNVAFSRLQAINFKGRSFTGAVTVYESKVSFLDCSFEHNNSEDALNLIRSEYSLDRCTISNTTSDALDADFGNGNIRNCVFSKAGNDGVDVSGGTVNIWSSRFENIGDKAVSAGEGSEVRFDSVSVNKALFGMVAKDKSMMQGSNLELQGCDVPYLIFCKKKQYGSALINIKTELIPTDAKAWMIEEGSRLVFNNDTIRGIGKIDVEAMYSGYQ
jgi:uncharacterized protein YjbI with pentapeptide repeats